MASKFKNNLLNLAFALILSLLFYAVAAQMHKRTRGALASGYENEEEYLPLGIEGLHVDGHPRVVTKTCFPVTMQVCVPATFCSAASGENAVPPVTSQGPPASECVNDDYECPAGASCSTPEPGGNWCYGFDFNTETSISIAPYPCSLNCNYYDCSAEICRQCSGDETRMCSNWRHASSGQHTNNTTHNNDNTSINDEAA